MTKGANVLEKYISDIPRFKNWDLSRNEKIDFLDWKGFVIIHPEKIKYQQAYFLVKNETIIRQSTTDAFKIISLELMNRIQIDSTFIDQLSGSKIALLYILFHLKMPYTVIKNEAEARRFNVLEKENIEVTESSNSFTPPTFELKVNLLKIKFWAYSADTDKSLYFEETLSR